MCLRCWSYFQLLPALLTVVQLAKKKKIIIKKNERTFWAEVKESVRLEIPQSQGVVEKEDANLKSKGFKVDEVSGKEGKEMTFMN